ncbi:hypothetical protein ANCCEY_00404 [Ancylostoma ceylanicum]|uniref:GRIP domain-containing protein n=1 Tax=Ancylostoma ceylanicum TaxID=53326 RepID=A0A0D6MDE2_9BILA|nr:hypothetical protein ANCCEY_00404 [Ancylostoma ceylanicum]
MAEPLPLASALVLQRRRVARQFKGQFHRLRKFAWILITAVDPEQSAASSLMNARDLQKTLENQHEQLKLYEKKLKDVVRAYKSLDAEKSALQKALDSLSQQDKDEESTPSTSSESLQVKLQQVEIDRERELADHGKVLAEMQARFAKEHQSFEAGAKESAVLSKKINQKDEALSQLKAREADLVRQVAALSKEVKELTEKAYHVPSIQILKDEMANLKNDHVRELRDAVTKTKHSTRLEEQEKASQKIAELEAKTMSLLETIARSEEARSEAHEALLQAEEEKQALAEELLELRSRQKNLDLEDDDEDAVTTLKLAIAKIREKNPGFDFHDLLGPDPEKKNLQHELRSLKDEYDQLSEMEAEMQKQRSRTIDVVAEKERELEAARNVSHQLDYRLREVEQAALVKELEHHKKTEAMSEEITKLQNKLSLLSTGGEMEYLRNIFVQFIQSNNSSAKKNILKAMGMALKLSANEMKSIESK